MTKRNIVHAAFVVERLYPHAPARVFQAFADEKAKARWFAGPEDFETRERAFDFRVGGREVFVGKHGAAHGFNVSDFRCTYFDIVPNERIVYAYSMALDNVPISVSLATIELEPDGPGTRLTVTEHGAFLDGYQDGGSREHGTAWLMDQLGKSLQTEAV